MMNHIPRPSLPGEEAALRQLWKLVFGDSDAFLDRFFSLIYTPGMAWVICEEDEIVSAAYAIQLENAVYIYAVATNPKCRGKGYGKAVTLAAAQGKPAYLYPAELSLRDWYAREMGAVTVSYRPKFNTSDQMRPITAEEYNHRRESMLTGTEHAVYPTNLLQLFEFAGTFMADDHGIYAVEPDGTVKEALPCEMDKGEPFVMGLNNAAPMYWGLVFD